jgi:hypothetical protein
MLFVIRPYFEIKSDPGAACRGLKEESHRGPGFYLDILIIRQRTRMKKDTVGSSGERNAFGELSGWCHEAKGFPWPSVELERDSIEIVLAVSG